MCKVKTATFLSWLSQFCMITACFISKGYSAGSDAHRAGRRRFKSSGSDVNFSYITEHRSTLVI